MNLQVQQYPSVAPVSQRTVSLVVGGSIAVTSLGFVIWAMSRKKSNPFLATALLEPLLAVGAGIIGMKAEEKRAKAAIEAQNIAEQVRRGEAERAQQAAIMSQNTAIENDYQRSLYDDSRARRNQQITILAGVGGFAALMTGLFIYRATKK